MPQNHFWNELGKRANNYFEKKKKNVDPDNTAEQQGHKGQATTAQERTVSS